MAELDKKALMDFLEEVDNVLPQPIQLVAVGGTALTLMDCKPSTRDVDFTGPRPSIRHLRAAINRLQPGFKVDTWSDCQVFMITLPGDCVERAILVRRMAQIELRHAHPVDLIVTKLGRYDDRDQDDIKSTVRKFQVKAKEIRERAQNIQYAGNDQLLAENLQHLLNSMK